MNLRSNFRLPPPDLPVGWVALAALLVLAGCGHQPAFDDPLRTGPFYQPRNFVGEPRLPAGMRRVVVLPVSGGHVAPPETAAAFDAVVIAALQRQARFEIVALSRADCQRRFDVAEFASTAPLPHGFLDTLARAHAADGVIFVDLTVFHPIRPLTLGVRAKLAAVVDSRLVWACDEVFSTADPAVANSARRHFLQTKMGAPPVDLSRGVLLSPNQFGAYVADAVFRTLPPR
jgi:hypothetical protein